MVIGILLSIPSFAQKDSTAYPVNRLRLDYYFPGGSYELGIARKMSVVARSNFSRVYDFSSIPLNNFDRIFNSTIVELRYYYDPFRIFKTKPHWRKNSGIYHAVFGRYNFQFYKCGSFKKGVGFVHGFQRVYRKFSFNVSGGILYSRTEFLRDPAFYPYFSGSISYAF